MNSFTDDWLALREPADFAARNRTLTGELATHFADQAQARTDRPLSILDLGSGTGSNFRYLAPQLGHQQLWRLVDYDDALLQPTQHRLEQWAPTVGAVFETTPESWRVTAPSFSARVSTLKLNLAVGLNELPWHHTDLLTGSALLDLVSQAWLDELASLCQLYACPALFALTYDGRVYWHPPLADDESMTRALNQHQQTDKGFGKAMGPRAAQTAIACFAARQFRVQQRQTDWVLNTASISLQKELATGWAGAVAELDTAMATVAQRWLTKRLASLSAKDATLTIGHVDFLAVPVPR